MTSKNGTRNENLLRSMQKSSMHEIIYNIYIWDYHYDTAINEEWLDYLLNEAKQKAKGRPVKVEEEKVSIEVINKMIDDKIADNRKVWEEAKKTDDVIGYVNMYWARKEYEKALALL